jgi:hypothetical protein
MLYPELHMLAKRLTPIVVSEENDKLLIEPSVSLKLKSISSVYKLASAISPSEKPIATVFITGLCAIIVTEEVLPYKI